MNKTEDDVRKEKGVIKMIIKIIIIKFK